MPLIDKANIRCRQSIIDNNRQICAGYNNLSIDTCSDDSGGLLLIVEYNDQNQGHFVATETVSYGYRQCDSSISSNIYARVVFYFSWIHHTLSRL